MNLDFSISEMQMIRKSLSIHEEDLRDLLNDRSVSRDDKEKLLPQLSATSSALKKIEFMIQNGKPHPKSVL